MTPMHTEYLMRARSRELAEAAARRSHAAALTPAGSSWRSRVSTLMRRSGADDQAGSIQEPAGQALRI